MRKLLKFDHASFSQVAETRLHEVDEKLDEIEQIMALYEAKLESVPE